MKETNDSSDPERSKQDELNDSWFDLPILTTVPKKPRAPEAELDDSWFDRPGGGIKRSDVLDR